MNIRSLVKPKTVAVIGATEKAGFGANTCKNLLESDLGENLYFVNPRRTQVMGKECYPSISDIPVPVEMVVICTPRSTINSVLEEAGTHGCKAAIVYASGYSEMKGEGIRLEKELKQVAIKHGIALCGPNCAGFVNTVDKIWAFGLPFTGLNRQGGNVGLIAQSGQVCLQLMNVNNIGYSYVISSGNNAVVDIVDYLQFMVDDVQTKVIALYLEGVHEPLKFTEALAKAARKRKPIIVLKAGASDKGSQIAAAHTGSLAGSNESFNAIFNRFGVIRVNDMEQLLTTSLLFSKLKKLPQKSGVAISNLSGGETAVFADLAYINELNVPDFAKETKEELKKVLPDYATPNNPLDMTATVAYDPKAYRKTLRTIMRDPSVGMLVLGVNVPAKLTAGNQVIHNGVCDGVVDVMKDSTSKPIVVVPSLSGYREPGFQKRYEVAGVPILPSPHYAFTALKQLDMFLRFKPEEATMDIAVMTDQVNSNSNSLETLSEHQSKSLLKEYGVPIPIEYLVKSESDLVEAAKDLGYPVVLKIDSPDTPHKTDIGGVKLCIDNEINLINSYREILENVRVKKPDARINGVIIQKMLSKGLEMIIGITRDEQFGPMVLVGLGGIFVEVYKDVVLSPANLSKKEALEMINSLKAEPLFKGYRGSEELDIDALADLVVSIGRLASEKKDVIYELDLNPVFVYPKGRGVKVVDALVVLDYKA